MSRGTFLAARTITIELVGLTREETRPAAIQEFLKETSMTTGAKINEDVITAVLF